jgi:hypothetical protein
MPTNEELQTQIDELTEQVRMLKKVTQTAMDCLNEINEYCEHNTYVIKTILGIRHAKETEED